MMNLLSGDSVSHPMYGSGTVETVFNRGRLAIVQFGLATSCVPTSTLDREVQNA